VQQSWKVTVISVGVIVAIGVIILVIALTNQRSGAVVTSSEGNSAAEVVRQNSHVLDEGGDGAIVVVEFLDFECEICGAFYPIVEDLRARYAGDITYVLRYFPIPSHFNSMNAAIAAEAAAQQGRLEEMYQRLFETQSEWGEGGDSRAELFRSFAVDLGLNMEQFDAAVADPATRQRVEEDFNDGRALGVDSTPTFFIDGEKLDLQRLTDLGDAIEEGLALSP
jgi:protein-disulfide isomerase